MERHIKFYHISFMKCICKFKSLVNFIITFFSTNLLYLSFFISLHSNDTFISYHHSSRQKKYRHWALKCMSNLHIYFSICLWLLFKQNLIVVSYWHTVLILLKAQCHPSIHRQTTDDDDNNLVITVVSHQHHHVIVWRSDGCRWNYYYIVSFILFYF